MGVPMHVRQRSGPLLAACLTSAGVGAVWYIALMRDLWAAASRAPICGHAGMLVAHCPPCYAALTLMGVGLGGAAMSGFLKARVAPAHR